MNVKTVIVNHIKSDDQITDIITSKDICIKHRVDIGIK